MRNLKFICYYIIITISIFFIFFGCSNTKYNNISEKNIFSITENVVHYLMDEYPPSYARLHIEEPIKNLFEFELIKMMRAQGYNIPWFTHFSTFNSFSNIKRDDCLIKPKGTNFKYIVNIIAPKLYRVTIYLGTRSHSIAFIKKNDGNVYPAGPWTRECDKIKVKIN